MQMVMVMAMAMIRQREMGRRLETGRNMGKVTSSSSSNNFR